MLFFLYILNGIFIGYQLTTMCHLFKRYEDDTLIRPISYVLILLFMEVGTIAALYKGIITFGYALQIALLGWTFIYYFNQVRSLNKDHSQDKDFIAIEARSYLYSGIVAITNLCTLGLIIYEGN